MHFRPSKGLILLLALAAALAQLPRLGPPRGLSALERDLVAGSVRDRRIAALRLSDHAADPAYAAEALVEALWDVDSSVRAAARRSLALLGEHAVPPLVVALEDESLPRRRPRCAYALGELGAPADAARGALLSAADAEEPFLRLRAIEALGKLPTRDAALDERDRQRLVTALLLDSHGGVRHAAARAIARRDHARAIPALVHALETDESAVVRHASALALGDLASDSRAAEVKGGIGGVGAPGETAGSGALVAVGSLADGLVRALREDDDEFVRAAAAHAIGRCDVPAARERARRALSQALQDESQRVRVAAAAALRRIG